MREGYINIANNVFTTLLAISSKEQEQGLMYVDPPTPIMSFIYSRPQINKFWMNNTKSPLDIVFSHNGIITQICKGEPYSTAIIGDDRLSDLIVEFPYGTAASTGIKLGNKIMLLNPSIEELKSLIY